MKENNRDSFYDCVRGFAILLVVLGHTVQCLNPSWSTDTLSLGIMLFHMPLFAFLSGLFFVRSYERYTSWELIKRRFVQLMLPCMSWGTFSIVVAVVGKMLNGKPMDYPYYISFLFSGLWYLSTIFGLIVIGIVVHNLVRRLPGGGGGILLAGQSHLLHFT